MKIRHSTGIIILTLCALVDNAYAKQGNIQIILNDLNEVSQQNVTLKDVATIKKTNGAMVNEDVMQIPLMTIDRVNQYRRIKKETIRSILSKYFDDAIIEGPEVIAVKLRSQLYDISVSVDNVVLALKNHYKQPASHILINPVGSNNDIYLPEGEVTYRFDITRSALTKRVCVWVNYFVNDTHYQTLPLWFEQEFKASALVSNKNIEPGRVLNMSDFTISEVDITLYANTITPEHNISANRAKQHISKGSVLLASQIESLPAVYKGQNIEITSVSGVVTINATGVAVTDGEVGSVITVYREKSLDTFDGIVLAPGKVKVSGG